MATDRQIAANRLNARKSTGPRTAEGRERVRRNAVRHGLTARTVVAAFEDENEFKAFTNRITSDYAPTSPLSLELAQRLAALLWRLRRAHSIETGLFHIQSELQRNIRLPHNDVPDHAQKKMFELLGIGTLSSQQQKSQPNQEKEKIEASAHAFLRMCNINGEAFDRLSRYEVTIWRQIMHILVLMDGMHSKSASVTMLPPPNNQAK
jgi:hypothetical protein